MYTHLKTCNQNLFEVKVLNDTLSNPTCSIRMATKVVPQPLLSHKDEQCNRYC